MVKNVVIIGGGVSAKHAAEEVKKCKDVNVTVVQANKFVEWSIGTPYILARPELHPKLLSPNPTSFQVPGATYKYSPATAVDTAAKSVTLKDGGSVPYDALVVATGMVIPLILPGIGVTLEERTQEIKQAAEAIRKAKAVVVGGGGAVALDVAGDIKTTYPDKRVVILSRDKICKMHPEATRLRIEGGLKKQGIQVIIGTSADTPTDVKLEPGVIKVGSEVVAYDVFIPSYSRGFSTGFLQSVPDLLDDKGRIKVNKHLQSSKYPEIFAVGTADVDEPWIGLPKLEAQWKTVGANVKNFFDKKPLKEHKEGMPEAKVPPVTLIGRGKGGWADIDFNQTPAFVRNCCCCCGLGGFPCCPPPCCWCCCHPCGCGYCCGPAAGESTAKCLGPLVFKFGPNHIKGLGEAPKQMSM